MIVNYIGADQAGWSVHSAKSGFLVSVPVQDCCKFCDNAFIILGNFYMNRCILDLSNNHTLYFIWLRQIYEEQDLDMTFSNILRF